MSSLRYSSRDVPTVHLWFRQSLLPLTKHCSSWRNRDRDVSKTLLLMLQNYYNLILYSTTELIYYVRARPADDDCAKSTWRIGLQLVLLGCPLARARTIRYAKLRYGIEKSLRRTTTDHILLSKCEELRAIPPSSLLTTSGKISCTPRPTVV